MKTFFTVDRKRKLAPSQTIVANHDLNDRRATSIIGLFDTNEMIGAIQQSFPTGIGEHGKRFLLDESISLEKSSSVPTMPMIELIFELVRRYEFPERPSRMNTLFGCRSLEEAQRFRTEFGSATHPIFQVQCEDYFLADMHLLQLGTCTLNAWLYARKYWMGLGSANPFWESLLVSPVIVEAQVA